MPNGGPYDVSAYCVVDNDYAVEEFGVRNTPLENLQVTVAHEYFHAVQFAYDFYEAAGSSRRPRPGSRTSCTTASTTTWATSRTAR